MKILTKKQAVERYGLIKYYDLQGWLHNNGSPTERMVDAMNALRGYKDEDFNAEDDVVTVYQWGHITIHWGSNGYPYLTDAENPGHMLPAYTLVHEFGGVLNYVPDVG